MTKGKTTLTWKNPEKNLPKLQETHNLPTDDVENTAQIREGIYDLLTSQGLFLEEQKVCCKWTRGTGELLYIDQHILHESTTRRKKSRYCVDWLQKGIRFSPAKLDNKLPRNSQDIRRSHKIYREDHEYLENRIDYKREKSLLKRRSKDVYSREMHYHHHYL